MKLTVIFSTFVFILLGALVYSPTAHAADADDFMPGYLISDSTMRDTHTMGVNDIQNFLNQKMTGMGGCEENHGESNKWTDFGRKYRCLKDYREDTSETMKECTDHYIWDQWGFGKNDSRYDRAKTMCWWKGGRANFDVNDGDMYKDGDTNDSFGSSKGRSAAKMIKDVSNKHDINPQVLLVLLQKEQSMIEDVWPWIVQYQSATGFGCPDTAECDPKWRGFYNQINEAAKMFDEIMDQDSSRTNWYPPGENDILYHPNTSCGSDTVYVRNLATSALYNYTPYQPNQAALDNLYGTGNSCSTYGNRNFWRDFTDWFGDPTFPLLFRIDGGDKVYLAWGDYYYHVVSPAVIKALNLDGRTIEDISASSVDHLVEGPRLTTLVKFGDAVYQIDNRRLLHFSGLKTSGGDTYATGREVLEQAYDLANAGDVTKYPESLKLLFFNYKNPDKISLTVSARGEDAVYFIQNGKKHRVPSREVYHNMRGNVGGNPGCPTYDIQRTNVSARLLDETKRPHKGKLSKASGHKKLAVRYDPGDDNYIIVNGKRRKINEPGNDRQAAWGLEDSDFLNITEECADSFAKGGQIKSNLIRIGGGTTIYKMKGGNKHSVVSRAAFDAYGFDMNDVIDVPVSAADPMQADHMKLFEPGTLIQKSGSDAVYAINKEFKLKRVPSRELFDTYGFSFSDVIEVGGFNHFDKNGSLTRWVKNPANNNVWVVDQGVQHRLHLDEQDHYAWDTRDSVDLLTPFHKKIEDGRDATRYVRSTSNPDPVYRIEQNDNGESVKRKYNSSKAFECDAEWSDTMKISDTLLDGFFVKGTLLTADDTCN